MTKIRMFDDTFDYTWTLIDFGLMTSFDTLRKDYSWHLTLEPTKRDMRVEPVTPHKDQHAVNLRPDYFYDDIAIEDRKDLLRDVLHTAHERAADLISKRPEGATDDEAYLKTLEEQLRNDSKVRKVEAELNTKMDEDFKGNDL